MRRVLKEACVPNKIENKLVSSITNNFTNQQTMPIIHTQTHKSKTQIANEKRLAEQDENLRTFVREFMRYVNIILTDMPTTENYMYITELCTPFQIRSVFASYPTVVYTCLKYANKIIRLCILSADPSSETTLQILSKMAQMIDGMLRFIMTFDYNRKPTPDKLLKIIRMFENNNHMLTQLRSGNQVVDNVLVERVGCL